MFNLFKQKKKPKFTYESVQVPDQPNVEEVRVFKDGKYSHAVKVLCFPENIIERLEKIKKAPG